MTKHLSIQKVLATLLTIVAVFAGQQAFATITSPMSLTGNSALMNGQYYHVWKTEGFLGNHSQPRTEGSSYTFNGQNIGLQGGAVRITGTLNFTQADDFTDVTTGSTVTVEFYSTNFWFFSAEVKKLDGTSVSGCSYSASSDHSSITVTIPSGKTFGNIYLGYSVHPQMTESNTTISGIEATYIYQGSAIGPQPTVVYTNPNHSQTTLTLNTDYTLSYTNNNGPGIATVIITGAGEYAGTLTRTYTIRNIDLNDFNSLGNNTYEITNKDDLDHLALLVDVAANDCQGLTFKQTADITYSHGSSTTENNFTQIGGYFGGDKNFSGTYDGQNHTISGIRVYKSPSTNTNENKNVALFGRISGATIQNVILTDARITGYRYVGGLVGNKASGTVQNCLIVGSTITCGNTYGGALFGSNSGTLTANHYRNCTVNNTTNATNVGVGNGSSSNNDMAGARSVHPLTIQNANITATGESVAYQGTTYYASNTQITLGYNNLPAGYTLTYTLNGTALSGNTFTMPANDNATVTATAPLTPITYNITYDLDGGSVATANPTTYNIETATFTLNNPTREGYTFAGWTGTDLNEPTLTVTIAQGSIGDRSYTATWNTITYNITYDLGGGSVATANPTTYNITTPTFTLTNPTKAACTFDGWTGSNGTTPQTTVTIAQGSTGDRSYTAQWTQYAFTLTLGANITASGTVAFTLDGTDYYAPGTEITLAYSGTIPEGQHLVFYVNGTPIANNGNTFAMPAANATVSVAFCYWPGSGTENDPFIISTTTELDLLAQNVNSGNSYVGKFFKLGADIAYDPNVLDANGENYTTIGIYNQHIFIGSFDGDGHTISGIRSSQGLFAVIRNYDECSFDDNVKNVTLADAVITGNDYIGGIVGENMYGHIKNCKVINTVINGGIVVGGIVGHNDNDYSHRINIEDCQVINTVINGNLAIGGIAGWLDFGQIESCQVINTDINGAQALGGIAGINSGSSIENCLALDTDITATQQPNPYSGAIVGSTNSTLTSNYYHGCSMNNETSGIGTGDGDITENDGAMQVFSLSLSGNVTATPDPVVTYNGTGYYFAGTTITLVYGGTIPEGCSLVYSVNGNAIEGNSFEMPTQDVAVTLTKQGLRYTFNSNTGALALIWGDFNSGNKWGSEVTATAVTSVTATNDVSFTGNCYNLFYNFTNCTSMELGNVNTDALNNMYCMFWGCSSLTTLDLSGWNTANVTNMSSMFSRSTSLQSLNLSGWNTANVTNMSGMFRECSGLQSLDLSGWNTANVTTMERMFYECLGLQSLDLSGWNTANVTDMSWMFQQCSSLQSLSLSGWNTANVTDMSWMFQQCSSLQSLNVSGWNTANVTNMYNMFQQCSSLQSLSLTGWNTANVTQMSSMFQQCSSLQSLSLSGWNTSNVENMSYMFNGCSGLQSLDLSGWNTANVTTMERMFYECSGLQSLDLTGWSTSNVENMSGMFRSCSGLQSLDLSGWNTANVTDMYYMFDGCSSLQSLDLTGWNTANVTDMYYMFDGCSSLQSLDLTGWNTSNVTDMSGMFDGCSSLQSLDLTGWNTANVTDMYYMFDGCSSLQSLDLTGWNTSNVTDMSGMFHNCTNLATIYVGEGWNTSSVTSSNYMFSGCTSLVGGMGTTYDAYHIDKEYAHIDGGPDNPGYLSRLRYTFNSTTGELALLWGEFNKDNKWGSEVTSSAVTRVTATDEVSFTGDCFNLFYYFTHCTSMDLNNVNTDNLTNIRCMFWGCQSLTTLNLSSWNTAAVTEMTSAFRNCTGLTSLNLSGWNTANVTNMIYMFLDCSSLQSLDLSGWNTANVTDMSYMFWGCSGLQSLNVSGWNTANVTNMSYMFWTCSGLQSLNVSGWNTANVTNMSYMFWTCSGLQSLNVSGWNTANVTDMSSMFGGCSGLQSLDLSGWNTAKVTDMSFMFYNCSGLQSLDLTGWNTANVTNMIDMFEGCSGLQSLDLSGWNTAKVTDMSFMFYGCTHLATIYVGEGWSTSRVNWSNDMFSGCTSLVGGMGTHYISFHTDKRYARIDGGPHNPGYFTAPFTKEIAGYEDNESGWYLIASPLAADIAPTAVTNMTNETFDLYYFDQTGGNNGKEWKNWKNEGGDGYHFNLESGKGYLYANSGNVTLSFTGIPYIGDGVVNLTYSTDNSNATMHGWNLIGNPFSTNATIGDTPFYRMNAAGSEIIAADVNDNTVNPMEGIFVKATQANQTVTFETAMTRGNANSNSAALVMDISQNRGGVIDRAIVRFDEGQTLPKFQIHENSTKIYIPQDGTDYAVAVIASDSEAIQPTEHPIHFKAAENGTYTLTISTTFNSQLSTVNYLHLIDNMTGADVDLLASAGNSPSERGLGGVYTFTAKTTDYESRFKLVFAVGSSTGSDTFAFINNGNIIVNGEGTLQIFDAMGRQLFSKELSTFNSQLSTLNYTPGVYVLRLINGENVRTQKIVIE